MVSILINLYYTKSIFLYHVSQYAEVKCQTNDYYSKYTYCFPRAHIVVVAENTEIKNLTFCAITFEPIKIWTHEAPQNDRLNFSFVTDIIVDGKKMSRNGCKIAVCQSPHFLLTYFGASMKYMDFLLNTCKKNEIHIFYGLILLYILSTKLNSEFRFGCLLAIFI